MLDQPKPQSTPAPSVRVHYNSIGELVSEWQASGDERPIWEYVGVSESIFRDWASRVKTGVIDA